MLPLVVQSLPTLGQRATYVRAFLWAMPGAPPLLSLAGAEDGFPGAGASMHAQSHCCRRHLTSSWQPQQPLSRPTLPTHAAERCQQFGVMLALGMDPVRPNRLIDWLQLGCRDCYAGSVPQLCGCRWALVRRRRTPSVQ